MTMEKGPRQNCDFALFCSASQDHISFPNFTKTNKPAPLHATVVPVSTAAEVSWIPWETAAKAWAALALLQRGRLPACLSPAWGLGGRPEPVPTRSPTSSGLRVQVIRPLAISPKPANKTETNTFSSSSGEREETERKGGRTGEIFFLC